VISILVVVVAIGLAIVWLKVVRGGESAKEQLATFAAQRGPLTISVLESGTIKSREQTIIKNQVEGRTSIISLIPEGTRVKKGQLLVELDASTMDDDKIEQEIRTLNAKSAYVNAKETLEIVKSQAISDVNVAELTLEFARQDLEQYKIGQFPNEETAAQSEIDLAKEELVRAEETLGWSQRLFKEKYISQTELQGDQLAVSRSKNKLLLAEADLKMLQDFTYKRQIKQLSSDVDQAEMALERAKARARADVVQAEADFEAKTQEYTRQQARLDKLLDQISKAKVYAPADGMVIYATTARRGGWRDNRQPLDEGVEVYERQELIYLPTADSAMAEVDIHEASLEKVRVGLPAIITVDALPGQRFVGTVSKIAPLPDPQSMWMNPDLKVYNSDVQLESESPELRTGMSCKVEIIVAQYEGAIFVPVQAVIRVNGQPTVYVVKEDGSTVERQVKIGLDNNRMVVIEEGLSEGEVVWLAPPLGSATVGSGLESGEANGGDHNGADSAVMRRVNQKLEEVNGSAMGERGQGWPGQDSDQASPGQGPSGEQMDRTRRDFQSMTPDEQKRVLEQMRERGAQGDGGFRPGGPGEADGPGGQRRPQGQGGQGRGSRPEGPGEGGGRSRPQGPGGGQ
jgi:HlyD family secretion protein